MQRRKNDRLASEIARRFLSALLLHCVWVRAAISQGNRRLDDVFLAYSKKEILTRSHNQFKYGKVARFEHLFCGRLLKTVSRHFAESVAAIRFSSSFVSQI